jgi:hypothetical protein
LFTQGCHRRASLFVDQNCLQQKSICK